MKLTDAHIDKLFQESAAKQSFLYKPEYWETFSASLPDARPVSNASDTQLDGVFQEGASEQSFEYKPEYWDEFAASLPNDAPLSQVSDDALDAAFQHDASNISVDYKQEFWNEFSDSLPLMVATENIADAEVDAMYREEAANLSFEYKPSYWEEMAAMLRRRRRRPDFLWFGMSGLFATAIIAMLFVEQSPLHVELNTPRLGIDNASLESAKRQNNQLASNVEAPSNSSTNSSNAQSTVQSDNYASNAGNGSGTSTDLANNVNSINQNNANASNLGTNGVTAQKNGTGNMRRMRALPPLVLTTFINSSEQQLLQTSEIDPISGGNDLATRELTSLEQSFDNTLAESNLPVPPKYRGGIISKLYVQGIGGVSQSSITPSDAISTSYGFGLGWQASKSNWTFNLGSNVLIENFSDLQLTRSAKVYGFGADLYQYDLLYKRLYTAELDLGLGYNFGRHQLRLSVRPSYTFSSLVDVSETSISSTQGEIIASEETRTSVYGFMDGIQEWGVKPSFGYAYNFPTGWTLGLTVGTELIPSINEDFISGVNNTMPLDGQLYIRKTLNFR